MKTKILFQVLVININLLNAQYAGEVIYNYQSTLPLEKSLCGETLLYFGKDSSIYVHLSAIAPGHDESIHEKLMINSSDVDGYPISINKVKKKFQQKIAVFFNFNTLICDDLQAIKWEILDSVKTNSDGIKLQYAKGKFGGRNYLVWYCADIPFDSGPFKLWGLPGLILEAETEDGTASMKYKSIDFYNAGLKQINPHSMGKSDYQYTYFNYCQALDRFEKELLSKSTSETIVTVSRPKPESQLEIGFKK